MQRDEEKLQRGTDGQKDEQDVADKRKQIQSKGAVQWRPGGSWVMDLGRNRGRNKNWDCASLSSKKAAAAEVYYRHCLKRRSW